MWSVEGREETTSDHHGPPIRLDPVAPLVCRFMDVATGIMRVNQ